MPAAYSARDRTPLAIVFISRAQSISHRLDTSTEVLPRGASTRDGRVVFVSDPTLVDSLHGCAVFSLACASRSVVACVGMLWNKLARDGARRSLTRQPRCAPPLSLSLSHAHTGLPIFGLPILECLSYRRDVEFETLCITSALPSIIVECIAAIKQNRTFVRRGQRVTPIRTDD